MTQLCESDAIASSSAAVAEAAAQVTGVPGFVDDMYFLRHILDMKPLSSEEDNNLEILTSPNSPPTPQRTRSRLLGHRQSMTGSSSFSSQQPTSPYSSPPMSTSPNGFGLCHPGMKDVPIWLKTLRLHKYTTMFQDLTYDEMMNLNERQLELRKVTKGARKKILQSLEKLRERVSILKSLDKVLNENLDVTIVISELRAILNTPICTYKPLMAELLEAETVDGLDVSIDQISEQNIPGHIIHITSRFHEILFDHGKIVELEDEYLLRLLQIYERICSHESFNSKQRNQASQWKRTLRKIAVDRNLLPSGNHVGVGYAGFKRYQQRMSSSTTRSSTTSPPESSCAISPPPMPQSYSAPQPSSTSASASVSSISTAQLPFDKLYEHPQGAALIKQLVALSLQIQNGQKDDENTVVMHHKNGGTKTPPNISKERISISKSLSSPDNSRLNKPLTPEEKMAFLNNCRQESNLSSTLPPTPPQWGVPETSSRYYRVNNNGMPHQSSMPSTMNQWGGYHNHTSLPPTNINGSGHPSMISVESRRSCYAYNGRQSLSARMPSSTSHSSSGFSSGGSDRSSGAGSPTSHLHFPITKWSVVTQGSYNSEMCNNQNMPPVK